MTTKSRIHSFHPEGYGDLKTAVRNLLHAVGGEAKAAELCRVSKSTLSEYGNPRYADRHIPLDVALDAWAEGIALLGCVLSLLAMLGQQHVLVFIGLYALYLSLYLAGQSMLSFQWVSRHDIAGI